MVTTHLVEVDGEQFEGDAEVVAEVEGIQHLDNIGCTA